MGKKFSKEFEMEFGKKMQKAKDDPAVQKWWDEEQVQLDLDLVQGEDDSGIQWDELSDDSKRELIMKMGYVQNKLMESFVILQPDQAFHG